MNKHSYTHSRHDKTVVHVVLKQVKLNSRLSGASTIIEKAAIKLFLARSIIVRIAVIYASAPLGGANAYMFYSLFCFFPFATR